jgi:hypothetical protein
VKSTVSASAWLNERDASAGDADIDQPDLMHHTDEPTTHDRPSLNRVAASPALVSRLVRKSIGLTSIRH